MNETHKISLIQLPRGVLLCGGDALGADERPQLGEGALVEELLRGSGVSGVGRDAVDAGHKLLNDR